MLPILVSKALSRLQRLAQPIRAGSVGSGRRINLALQGGGAHGAFTWGVLDEILADGRLIVDGISGASAGAINAVMLADGLVRGGPAAARQRLGDFWRAVSIDGHLAETQGVGRMMAAPAQRAAAPWLGTLARYWSPYELNPLNLNPLRQVIERLVDFAALRAQRQHEMFIAATDVASGEQRLFTGDEISADAVMASACLPSLFQAVAIDGDMYWDGGYSGNPPLLPFLETTETEDLLIVQINPLGRPAAPTNAAAIMARVHEVTFNAPLIAELRMLTLAERLIREGRLPRGTARGQYRRLRLHRIAMGADDAPEERSRLDNSFESMAALHARGRAAARTFLDRHGADIGRRSTLTALASAGPEQVAVSA